MLIDYSKKQDEALWYLEGLSEASKNYLVPINKTPFFIGRNKDCDLILAAKEISRKHAKIHFDRDRVFLQDLQSTNGCYKNNQKIDAETELDDGDEVRFGKIKFTVLSSGSQHETLIHTHLHDGSSLEENFADYYKLTAREKDILYFLIDGKATRKIAEKLCIAEGTAKNHVLNIFKKTGAHSRITLVNMFNSFSSS